MSAPISRSGAITRFIGRFCRESSPVSLEEKSWPASMPARSRIVVPEFPASNARQLLCNPRAPRPVPPDRQAFERRHTCGSPSAPRAPFPSSHSNFHEPPCPLGQFFPTSLPLLPPEIQAHRRTYHSVRRKFECQPAVSLLSSPR